MQNSTNICNTLSYDEITKHAGDLPWRIYLLETVDSTNTYAKALLPELSGSPAIIVSRQQTAGRGRRGHSFFSPMDKGIYMSIVIKPTVSPPTVITAAAAVAVCQVCEELTGSRPAIKWVNDIFYGGKKICGILTEGIFNPETGTLDTAIIGIGINLYTTCFPDDVKDVAGSLQPVKISTGRLIGTVAYRINCLMLRGTAAIMEEYKKRLMVLGKAVSYNVGETVKSGIAVDINDSGNLIVKTDVGTDILSAGEISLHKDFLK